MMLKNRSKKIFCMHRNSVPAFFLIVVLTFLSCKSHSGNETSTPTTAVDWETTLIREVLSSSTARDMENQEACISFTIRVMQDIPGTMDCTLNRGVPVMKGGI